MVLPAENGTMARIGRAAGQAACANAGPASIGAATALAENCRNLRRSHAIILALPNYTGVDYCDDDLSTGVVIVRSLCDVPFWDFLRTVILPSLKCSPFTVCFIIDDEEELFGDEEEPFDDEEEPLPAAEDGCDAIAKTAASEMASPILNVRI
jgi:hypothetical protein